MQAVMVGDGELQQHMLGLLAAASSSANDDVARAEALTSLRQTLLLPQAVPVLRRLSASLFQGLQLPLVDKSYIVRHAAGLSFGTLCALAVSTVPAANGRPCMIVPGSPADRFMGWAMPQTLPGIIEPDATVVALDSIREFLEAAEAWAADYFVPSVIQACQVLLEDERTSSMLAHVVQLLATLGRRFSYCLQPHFPDVMDLLLGWTLEADLPDSEQRIILDGFFHFQKLWSANVSFPINLLAKFLGDMEALAHDPGHGSPRQLRRLLSLVWCFTTILQATSGVVMGTTRQEFLVEAVKKMVPCLLSTFALLGNKFRDFEWSSRSLQCTALVAEILKGNFSAHYPFMLDTLLKRLTVDGACLTLTTFKSDIANRLD